VQLLRLKDVRQSRIPQVIGLCAADNGELPQFVNEAQRRLIKAGGETGWWGSWMRTAFNVDTVNDPFITCPRSIARLIDMDVCRHPVRIQNEFYEFLEAGIGLQPQNNCGVDSLRNCNLMESYDRGLFPTFSDLVPGNKRLRFYITDAADVSRRVIVQGMDGNGQVIRSLDGHFQIQGIALTFSTPFVQTPFDISFISGLQKDQTIGIVQIYEYDTTTGTQRLISTMEPTEEVAGYRRYFLNGGPASCCDPAATGTTTVQVTAMAKLAFIPVVADTDYLVIQDLDALKEACQAVRYGEMDDSTSAQQTQLRRSNAIGLLNGELRHHLGKDRPAVNFAPWGTARLQNQCIGSLT
jgi:hypothetical protein